MPYRLGDRWHLRGAERALGRSDGDGAEAIGAAARRGVRRRLRLAALDEGIHWAHDEEEHHCRDDEETHQRIQEFAIQEHTTTNRKMQG